MAQSFHSFHRTLFRLNNDVEVRYDSMPRQLKLLALTSTGEIDQIVASYSAEGLERWKSLYITFNSAGSESEEVNIFTYFANEEHVAMLSISNGINSITIGNGFNGFIQDVRVYVPMLQPMSSHITVPAEAAFLPRCLCPSGFTISLDELRCEIAEQASVSR